MLRNRKKFRSRHSHNVNSALEEESKGERSKGEKSKTQGRQRKAKKIEKKEPDNLEEEQSAPPQSKSMKVVTRHDQKKLIFAFVKNAFEKNPKGLEAEFVALKRINDFEKMKVFMENNTKGRNRYKDVGCLDDSRVKLRNFGNNDYIHGNYVRTPTSEKRFICTQAPLEKTCPDFWAMILQEGVENIMMLCNIKEKGAKKCFEYFPLEEEELKFGDYTIKCLGRKKFAFKCETEAIINETKLEVECEGKIQKLNHYHWVDWPDRGVPPADMAVIELLKAIAPTTTPIVVHCSAGIGRTGSVVLIQYIQEMVQTGKMVEDCASLLVELRQQRANSVQTHHQYLFVHMVLINHWLEEGLLDKTSIKSHLEKFTRQYKASIAVK